MRELFSKDLLKHYKVIDGPGTYIVQVVNTVKPEYIIDDQYPRYIVNLRASTEEKLIHAVKILGTRARCAWHEVQDCFIPGVIWDKDLPDLELLPTKGESVIATYNMVDGVLRCVSITLIPRKSLRDFNPIMHDEAHKLLSEINDLFFK